MAKKKAKRKSKKPISDRIVIQAEEMLVGTMQSLHQIAEYLKVIGDDVQRLEDQIRERSNVVECGMCGWWFDFSDVDEDDICFSCVESEE